MKQAPARAAKRSLLQRLVAIRRTPPQPGVQWYLSTLGYPVSKR
jgi:hypothetical protein